ncbi:MAG: ankyrin repeat domain-containing protein, partial [Bdellovibrionales bacterium]|nr:ankyrin repeat domain-containing protein [Bdellovibrionales bacterium]
MNLSGLRRVSEKILPDIKRILERIIPGKANENSKKNKPNILLLSQVKGSSLAGAVMALKMGADVNYVDKETGKTALHFAVANNALPIIELLIRNKARVDIAEKEKSFTQLMMATEANYQRAILIMIESPFSGLAKKDRL